MGIVSVTTDVTGQIGVNPRRVKVVTTDNLATVTTAAYFNSITLQGQTLYPTDFIDIVYSYNPQTNSGTDSVLNLTFANGIITAVQSVDAGNVLLPVVSGNFAVFSGTTGQIKDSGFMPSNPAKLVSVMSNGASIINHIATYVDTNGTIGEDAATAINAGNIQAGLSGTAGALISYPATAATGLLQVVGVANTGNTVTTFSNAQMAQASVISAPDPGASTANFVLTSNVAKTQAITGNITLNANPLVLSKVVTTSFAALATAGKVNIFVAPSVTAQIAILDIKVFFSTGLSGGGNRLLSLSDGTLVFNNTGITAALLGAPIFTLWGGTGNPLPSATEATISTAGANVYLQYIGGTTDYSAGSVIIAVTYAQVTT